METVEKRFWSKVDIRGQDECWNWMASSRDGRYGCFKYNGRLVDSHRIAYILSSGEIPKNLYVCHKCDNTKCCNPSHLFIGTARDNTQDAIRKGRAIIGKSAWKDDTIEKITRRALEFRKISINAPEGTKWCCSCKRYISLNGFNRNKSKVSGLEDECRTCKRKRVSTRNNMESIV